MKAFTLVETLVAITIVLLAVLGPFQLVQQSLSNSYVARDQLIATALAEEGLEYIRALRDSNYLYNVVNPSTPRSWLYGLNTSAGAEEDCFRSQGCTVDPTRTANNESVDECAVTCPNLKLNPSTQQYTQRNLAGYEQTPFTRKVLLEPVNGSSNTAVKVTVTVTYVSVHATRTVTVTDYLYNWL